MKKNNVYKKRCIVMLLMSGFLCLCSCRMEESYKKFIIKNVSDIEGNLILEEEDFARINSIVIIPEIKEIDHGEYIIYISAYSKTGEEDVIVKAVSMKDGKNTFLSNELNLNISMEKNEQDVYEGYITGGTFIEGNIEISSGKEFCLSVLVQVGDEMKEINYDIYIQGYKSAVMPT